MSEYSTRKRHSRSSSTPRRRAAKALPPALALLSLAGVAEAMPGTHAPSISTWDTRASSVVVGFRPGFLSGGHFDILSYNANFSATNGNLSSQFGVHYLNVRPGADQSVMQGLAATAVALFSIPVTDRYDDGTPKAAVGLYLGASPSVLISGRANFVSIPFVLGAGLPWAAAKAVLITPWFEASPGVNLDTRIRESTLAFDPGELTGTNGAVTLTDSAINKILNKAVDFKVTGTVGLRAGLDLAFRLGDSVDFNVNGMLGSLGGGFGGTFVGWVGAGLTFRWDRVVPAVLPAEKRLLHEDCSDIETRYRACQAVQGPAMSPVHPNPTYAPPSPTPSYPVQPQPAPAPSAPSGGYAPPPAPPPPVPEGAAPAAGTPVPTSSFPQ